MDFPDVPVMGSQIPQPNNPPPGVQVYVAPEYTAEKLEKLERFLDNLLVFQLNRNARSDHPDAPGNPLMTEVQSKKYRDKEKELVARFQHNRNLRHPAIRAAYDAFLRFLETLQRAKFMKRTTGTRLKLEESVQNMKYLESMVIRAVVSGEDMLDLMTEYFPDWE